MKIEETAMTNTRQVALLNQGSYITRIGSGKKPFTVGKALHLLKNLGVIR